MAWLNAIIAEVKQGRPELAYYSDMHSYESTRQQYRPTQIKLLLIAESPPPANDSNSSRQFYRTDILFPDDRLFSNTIKALYVEAKDISAADLEQQKEKWLHKFQADGNYMIEALDTSLPHEVTKQQRQALIAQSMTKLLARVKKLAGPDTKIILIKSNVFEVATEPLRNAGFTVLNTELVDYPGRFNQKVYRAKLSDLVASQPRR